MPQQQPLPTGTFGEERFVQLYDSLREVLATDSSEAVLEIYQYAVTSGGWSEVRSVIIEWMEQSAEREVKAFVGTDHGLTEPSALEAMRDEGVQVQIVRSYQGVYHPKVFRLRGVEEEIVWIGSNNLTKAGLLENVEFAVLLRAPTPVRELCDWAEAIASGSTLLSDSLLASYRRERNAFHLRRASEGPEGFHWSGRTVKGGPLPPSGALILEIMPRETGVDGKQIQIPQEAAREFFHAGGPGSSVSVRVKTMGSRNERPLTMTVFGNHTVRLVISDLDMADRPCVMLFTRGGDDLIVYEIVSRERDPNRYRRLLDMANHRTRSGSRRWGIVGDGLSSSGA